MKELRITNAIIYLISKPKTSYDVTSPQRSDPYMHSSAKGNVHGRW